MNLNEIYSEISSFNLGEAIREIGRDSHVLTQTEIITLSVTAAVGLLLCLFGWKIIRLWAALAGFALGAAVGAAVAAAAGSGGSTVLIAGLISGLILAVLGAVLYRAGIFLTVFTAVSSFCVGVINPGDWISVGICLAVGLVAAILAVRFASVLTIFVTTVYGASVAGTAVYHLLPVTGGIIHIGLCAVIGIIGLLVQLLLESRRQKKKSLEKAAEIREESSTAYEVERARAVMEDLDRIPQEDAENGARSEADGESEDSVQK